MKKIVLCCLLAFFVLSCSDKEQKTFVPDKKIDFNNRQSDSLIDFSGFKWEKIIKDEISSFDDFSISRNETVYLDTNNYLNFELKKFDSLWYSASIQLDSVLEYGEYTFYIESPLALINQNAIFSAGIKYADRKLKSNLIETGVQFTFSGDSSNNNIIDFYNYTTNKKFAGRYYPEISNKYIPEKIAISINIDPSKTIYSLYSIDKSNSKTLINQKIIDKSTKYPSDEIDALKYAKPGKLFKPFINFSLTEFDSPSKNGNLKVTISKFEYKKLELIADNKSK